MEVELKNRSYNCLKANRQHPHLSASCRSMRHWLTRFWLDNHFAYSCA